MRFAFTDLSRDKGEKLVFSWKNMFLTLWREVFVLIRTNLCFLLFCIPVVTIPAALTAVHGICVDAIQGKRSQVVRTFLNTLRSQFFQSWVLFGILSIMEFICSFGAWFYFTQGNLLTGILGLLMTAGAVVVVLMIPYCFCMLSRVDLALKDVIKNAFLLVFLNLKFSICSSVIALALLLVQSLFWLYLIPMFLLIGLSLTVYLSSYFSLYGLQKYVLTEDL